MRTKSETTGHKNPVKKPYYQTGADEVLRHFKTSASGLRKQDVPALQKQYGPNALQEAKQRSRFSILLSQFADVMILILIIAAVVSFVVGEHTDAYVIIAIIIGNAWMGYSQEYKAEESIRMLRKMSPQHALVLRDKEHLKVEVADLVPGDIILLEAGAVIPADARLIEVHALKTNETSLTGESHSVDKITEPVKGENLVPGDRQNMVFKGTVVSNGSGTAVVTATGMDTELGKIAGMLETEPQKTPLQQRLAKFSKQLAVIVIGICVLVFGFGLWRGEPPFQMFLTALSLAVAALPEALPAIITLALAQGARRMVKQKALMRNLPAVETLGSVTYICSDKTGTLTQNVMTVEKVEPAEGQEELLHYAMLVNNEVHFSGKKKMQGDSTETALVQYALDKGYTKKDADARYPLEQKLPFDSDRMRMSTLHRDGKKWVLLVKGAPVKIAEALGGKYGKQSKELLEKNREWAAEGLRVLFFAYKTFDRKPGEIKPEDEKDLDFLGMVAEIDPPRKEVIKAIEECKTAGIKTVMITGDQPLPAVAIDERLGMIEAGSDAVKTGADLEKMDKKAFNSGTKTIQVYARVSPEQKLNIVKSLQHRGEFVAMTGDGVNDAPSLKQSDIGVAMGITGTDVSKEAADMILLDDNFATIVRAVREGRRIYENIKKFILYVLSCNLAEILTIFFAPILGFAIPMLPIHILWINLLTDGLPGLALVAEPAEKDIMERPPRPPKESLFAGGMVQRILTTGFILTIASIGMQWWTAREGYEVRTQQTAVFTTLCFLQLGNALCVRSMHHSLFSAGFFANRSMWGAIALTIGLQLLIVYVPFLHPVFKTTTLHWEIMGAIAAVTVVCTVLIDLLKRIPFGTGRRRSGR